MKRKIFVCAACITMAGIYVNAQTKNSVALPAPPPPPMALLAPPPALTPPPVPAIDAEDIALVPPPAPPLAPVPPMPAVYKNQGLEIIINENGNEVSVRHINGKDIVFVKKGAKIQKIKLSTWNANRKYYQKKYGQLPPPAPEIKFTAPVIIKDRQ